MVKFFTAVLNGKVTHNEPAYVNLELFGHQTTLKPNETISPDLPDFHFGFKMSLKEFDRIAGGVTTKFAEHIHMKPRVVDAGTPMERKKMYLKCPTGYLAELKGYQ
jgi:extradiol dioxygenase family protein